jgi:hypothetical protein
MRNRAHSRVTGGETSLLVPQMSERAAEQQDAAVEAGASHGASLLILVFYGRQRGD